MTARVTTLKGNGAGEYYVHELPNYYLDAGEPNGVWHGTGAALLGLDGEVDPGDFLNLMAGADPRQPELLLGTRYTDESVRGFDVTASAPKSVSVLMAIGDDATREAVLQAHDVAVATMSNWIENQATTRFRVNGSEPLTFDAEGLVMATFRQHTSRALDPQIHTHVVVANKVKSPDGRWLALDARQLKKHQRTASTHYHLALRSELSSTLGIEWLPVENGIAEMAHMPQVLLDEFSSRTHDITRRLDEKIDRFIETMDREPTAREHWKLDREAVLDSRPTKAKDVSAVALHRHWNGQAIELGTDPNSIGQTVTSKTATRSLTSDIALEAVEEALASLSDSVSSWHPAELTRHIAAAIPTDVHVPSNRLVEVLDRMTRHTLEHRCIDVSREVPDGTQQRNDGRPFTESPTDLAYTTPEILITEANLMEWAERRVGHEQTDCAEAPNLSVVPLSRPQRQAAASVAGDAHLTLIVGPAGTGKTTALAPAIDQLRSKGRPVFGVAPSAAAADVLQQATGIAADTVDKLLIEHSLKRAPDHRYDLPVGSTIIVDEAGMLSTLNMERLANLADQKGWRVALVGDPLQFSAVGRGGMFQHLVDRHGAIELDRVHRFSNSWERDASLRLRGGDETVVVLYESHGRLHGGTGTQMRNEALDAWQQSRQLGQTVVLATPRNDTVLDLNRQAQQRRLDAGEIGIGRRIASTSNYKLHVGDEIVTRRNKRDLTTSMNQPVRNRDQWVVDSIYRNGDLSVTGNSGMVKLPAHYVREHIDLGYAQTSHATQGRTVDRSILYLDGPTDSRGVYVPMSRGKQSNDVYVATEPGVSARDVLAESISRDQVDRPAHARRMELRGQIELPGTTNAREIARLIDRRAVLEKDIRANRVALRDMPRDLGQADQRLKTLTGQRSVAAAELDKARESLAKFDRPFHRRGHELTIQRSTELVERRPTDILRIDREIAQVRNFQDSLGPQLRFEQRYAADVPGMKEELSDVSDQLDGDRRVRSAAMRTQQPDRVTTVLGPRPVGGEISKIWDKAAGQLDQHQSAYRIQGGVASQVRVIARTIGHVDSLSRSSAMHDELRSAVALERQQLERGVDGPSLSIGR